MIPRRAVLIGATAMAALGAAGALARPAAAALADLDAMLADRVLGKAEAPIEIVEYASLTCGHCATFHRDTLPRLQAEWLDTGKARLVFRDYPLDGVALRAAMMARCVAPERYFAVIKMLFDGQDRWSRARDPVAALGGIARLAGLTQAEFDACMANEPLQKGIIARALEAQQKYRVESTPSFLIDGKLASGAIPYERLDQLLKDAAPKG